MTAEVGWCRMGEWCATRGGSEPGLDGGRGLCWPDEAHGKFAIGRLPTAWRALDAAARDTLTAGRRDNTGPGPGPRVEPPTPLRLGFDTLARHIVWTLEIWAERVRDRAGLPAAEPARPGYAVGRDATLLVGHYSVLLALGEGDYMDYATGEPACGDGPGGVVQLVTLHQRARAMMGVTRRREPRDLPCPAPPEDTPELERWRWGCGQHSLSWTVSDDWIRCDRCGWRCTLDDYTLYALTFLPPGVPAPAR